jgi:hypothetical protein
MKIDPTVLKILIAVLEDYKKFPDKKLSVDYLIDYLERVALNE